jgi:hypothetical protein
MLILILIAHLVWWLERRNSTGMLVHRTHEILAAIFYVPHEFI